MKAIVVTFDSLNRNYLPAYGNSWVHAPNFFLRGWGPLEPFDDSMPELLKQAGVSTHLVTDHYHYFENGGAKASLRANSIEIVARSRRRWSRGRAWASS